MSDELERKREEARVERALDDAHAGMSALAVFIDRCVRSRNSSAEQGLEGLKALVERDVGIAIAERRAELDGVLGKALRDIKAGIAVMDSNELDGVERHLATIFKVALQNVSGGEDEKKVD